MRRIPIIIRPLSAALLSTAVFLVACGPDAFLDRREMYANVERTPMVRLEVDWLSRFGQRPTGMTVIMPGMSGGNSFSTTTNSVDGIDLHLAVDSYRTLVYNLSPGEFGSMDFHNENDYDSIRVNLTPIQVRATAGWDKDYTYAREPEDIGVALDTITVTPEMTERYSALVRQRLARGLRGDRADTALYVFRETPASVVSKLDVIVRVLGITNALSVEGNITDMADGYYLSQLHTTSTRCVHRLEDWKMYVDSTGAKNGYITTSIKTFGLPHGTEDVAGRDSALNYLNLYFKLRDDSTILQFHYAVGDLFRYVEERHGVRTYTNGVTLELELRINADTHPDVPDIPPDLPDVEDKTGMGFDATVDDWNEERKDVYL